jgi:aminopeptidase N
MIRLKHILEQTSPGRNNVAITAYNQIVNASAGWGTDPDAIVAAIGLLKTTTEFAQLLEQFKNKKTGYSSFNDMINEEYDRFNYSDIVKLVNKLKSIGVDATFKADRIFLAKIFF